MHDDDRQTRRILTRREALALLGTAAAKRGYEFTSQFYFDDAFSDRVFARNPYARRGRRTVRNERDGLFHRGGSQMILPVVGSDAGYAANYNIGLRLA